VKLPAGVSALVWPPTVTRTPTVPMPGGLVAVHCVLLLQLTLEARALPKATLVAPGVVLKPLPLIVTTVPPAAGPWFGLRLVSAGRETGV
jgi:hypothetical protein